MIWNFLLITLSLKLLLITLSFLALSLQILIGGNFNISKSPVCHIHRVTRQIAFLCPRYVIMPTNREISEVCMQFYAIKEF